MVGQTCSVWMLDEALVHPLFYVGSTEACGCQWSRSHPRLVDPNRNSPWKRSVDLAFDFSGAKVRQGSALVPLEAGGTQACFVSTHAGIRSHMLALGWPSACKASARRWPLGLGGFRCSDFLGFACCRGRVAEPGDLGARLCERIGA